jgi:hypothetical protein
MKKLFLVLLISSVSFGEMIGDFAPLAVGTQWKYNYVYMRTEISEIIFKDSIGITITLANKIPSGTDTMVLLQVKEEGIYRTDHDSVISESFIDTAIAGHDSIAPVKPFRCTVFPFWKTHCIPADSLSTGSFNNSEVKIYKRDIILGSGNNRSGYTYVQDVGLSNNYNYWMQTTHYIGTTVDLVSYNGKPFQVSTLRRIFSSGINICQSWKMTFLWSGVIPAISPKYDLKGRRIIERSTNHFGAFIVKKQATR